MIQSVMLVLLGVFAAALLVLLVAPAYWRRAVRITTDKLKRTMPMTTAEIRADKDRIRAESAIRIHRLQKKAEQLKLNEARQLIELNRRDARINEFDQNEHKLKADLTENQNARRVMEQTINYRLPQIESRLLESKRLLTARDREMMHFVKSAQKHDELLAEAKAFHEQQRGEIERLRGALTLQQSRDRGRVRDPGFGGEIALKSEIEALRSRNRDQTSVIERLQLEVIRFTGTAAGADKKSANGAVATDAKGAGDDKGAADGKSAADGPTGLDAAALAQRNKILAREVEDLKLKFADGGNSATSAGADGDGKERSGSRIDPQLLQGEIKKLRLKTEMQDEEIQGLTSELKAIYAASKDAGRPVMRLTKRVLNSKISALEKRTERQAETVARLRAELASANERAARQAAYYMKEMRQFGVGPLSQPYEVGSQEDRYSHGTPAKTRSQGNGRAAGPANRTASTSVKLVEKLDDKASGKSKGTVSKVVANARADRSAGAAGGADKKDVGKAELSAKGGIFGRKRLIDRISGAKKN